MWFELSSFPYVVSPAIIEQCNAVWQRLSEPGHWWNAQQKQAIVEVIRQAKPREVWAGPRTPVAELSHAGDLVSSPLVVDTIERLVTESGQLDKAWCQQVCKELGEGAYVELIAWVILVLPIDRFCCYLGRELQPLPEPKAGEASAQYPANLVDNGAWVKQTAEAVADMNLVNVSRAISMCPQENYLRRELVEAFYMEGHSFFDKVWKNKALSRPQLEIAATRTSVINGCFYCAHGHTMILDMAAKALQQKVSLAAAQGQQVDETGVEQGALILAFTEIANREPEQAAAQMPDLITALGERGAIELAATIAIFNGLNRTSDPTGVPMEETLMAYGRLGNKTESLGLADMAGINNTVRPSLLRSVWVLFNFQLRRLFGGGQ